MHGHIRVLGAVAVVSGCCSRAPVSTQLDDRAALTSADVSRLRAAVVGEWSTSQANDTSTITHTLAFSATEVTRSETSTQLGGTPTTTPLGSVPYRIDEHGALAFAPSAAEQVQFTTIVAAGETCAALHDRPCRVLGWDGLIAQAPAVYRREYVRSWQDEHGARRAGFVTIVRFAKPPAALAAGEPCTLAVDISAHGDRGSLSRTYELACDVAPAARGTLARIAVRGLDTNRDGLATAWSNYAPVSSLSRTSDRDAYDMFRIAFQPVMYFDPAEPSILYFDRPAGYQGTP